MAAFFQRELHSPTPFYRGWARLYLDRELQGGNADLRAAHAGILRETGQGAAEMTPEIAGDESVKWQMRNWVRVYFEFGETEAPGRGRLDAKTRALIENLFWNYVCARSHLRRADPRAATDIYGTENHEMMHYGNVLMALQALKNLPEYRDRALPEHGHSVREHYEAWNLYYREHCLARARFGCQIELFAEYWKYTMPELINLCDLAEDPLLRHRAHMLLDVLWADWAVGQLNGARGGGRTRIYQDLEDPSGGEAGRGSGNAWLRMWRILVDHDRWWNIAYQAHPIRGEPRVLAMARYRPDSLIADIAGDARERGEYVYVARRVAKQRAAPAAEALIRKPNTPWYPFDTVDTRMLSYEFCTPDYVMGTLVVDPAMECVSSQTNQDLQAGYPALTAQNRHHCIQFATGPDARVVPQCLGLANGKTYHQQQAVQHKNLLLVQRNMHSRQTGPMRIYFARGMRARLTEREGWFFLEEGQARLAVKAFQPGDGSTCPTAWDNEYWLKPADPDAPVALVGGRKARFPSRQDFEEYVVRLFTRFERGRLVLSGPDTDGAPVALSLDLGQTRLPEVDGRPVNFIPPLLYDSPFLISEYGTGVITLQKGNRRKVLDFTTTVAP